MTNPESTQSGPTQSGPTQSGPTNAEPAQSAPSDEIVEAIGKASEAMEYVERARGHLYSFHQLMGRADLLFGEAADRLLDLGRTNDGVHIDNELVGRNVLDGRWTFQVVDEFDEIYWSFARSVVRELEERHLGGRHHVFERSLKEQRRTRGLPGHEMEPPRHQDSPPAQELATSDTANRGRPNSDQPTTQGT